MFHLYISYRYRYRYIHKTPFAPFPSRRTAQFRGIAKPATMLEAGKHSKSIILTAVVLACCVSLLILNSVWHPSELLGTIVAVEPAPSTIPKKLWYKLGPNGLNDDTRAWTDNCIRNNAGYGVEFMTESSADAYVQNTFGVSHPELVEIYLGLTGSCLWFEPAK